MLLRLVWAQILQRLSVGDIIVGYTVEVVQTKKGKVFELALMPFAIYV